MLTLMRVAFSEALRTQRSNLFHTLLSTLGIIIGVGALVAILSLGDSMERFGREELAGTTDLSTIYIAAQNKKEIDGIWLEDESFTPFSIQQLQSIDSLFKDRAQLQGSIDFRTFLQTTADSIRKPAIVTGFLAVPFADTVKMKYGRLPSTSEYASNASIMVLSAKLAENLSNHQDPQNLIGKKISIDNRPLEIVGILPPQKNNQPPTAWIPIMQIPEKYRLESPAAYQLNVKQIEDVPAIKEDMKHWMDKHLKGGSKNYQLITNEFRLDQMMKGILVFKIIMGLITGIAVLVGGIGIMNVLLMSITERTREIGIRKALGAGRKAIALQFLSESLAISLIGCLLGLLLGLGFMSAAIPIVRHFAKVPFSATLSGSSVVVVLFVAVFIGVVFGTYPAIKASKLTPVDAIRHE